MRKIAAAQPFSDRVHTLNTNTHAKATRQAAPASAMMTNIHGIRCHLCTAAMRQASEVVACTVSLKPRSRVSSELETANTAARALAVSSPGCCGYGRGHALCNLKVVMHDVDQLRALWLKGQGKQLSDRYVGDCPGIGLRP